MVCDHFLDHGLAMLDPDLILDPRSKLVTMLRSLAAP